MSERTKIIAGNWKMNLEYEQGRTLARQVVDGVARADVLVILAVPFIHLKGMESIVAGVSNFKVAAQNCSNHDAGPLTGEICTNQLVSVGTEYVIIGHSERRQHFNETNKVLAGKVKAALAYNLKVIFCCGESIDVRENKEYLSYIQEQLNASVLKLSKDQFANIVIAYEPIWAIGTGKTASPSQVQEVHNHIRSLITEKFDADTANKSSLLYGGSIKPNNAKKIFEQKDVDGGLIGGASLKATDFTKIVNAI